MHGEDLGSNFDHVNPGGGGRGKSSASGSAGGTAKHAADAERQMLLARILREKRQLDRAVGEAGAAGEQAASAASGSTQVQQRGWPYDKPTPSTSTPTCSSSSRSPSTSENTSGAPKVGSALGETAHIHWHASLESVHHMPSCTCECLMHDRSHKACAQGKPQQQQLRRLACFGRCFRLCGQISAHSRPGDLQRRCVLTTGFCF